MIKYCLCFRRKETCGNTYHQIVTQLSPDQWVYPDQTSYVFTHRQLPSNDKIHFSSQAPWKILKQLKEQLNAWATGEVNLSAWNRSFLEHYTLIAVEGDEILGFGDIDETGYLDCLYIHKDHQRKGIASGLCDKLEALIPGNIQTHASITAKPFFKREAIK